MPVQLRKRKEPIEASAPPMAKRNSTSSTGSTVKKMAAKVKAAVGGSPAAAAPATTNGVAKKITVGSVVDVDGGFGGQVQTHMGQTTSLKDILEASNGGVVIFTYPKANTPGCTAQAGFFRDKHALITGASLALYGLSGDSPKSNTTFVTKQDLPYTLLCDPDYTLISAIGMKKPPKNTSRGVVIIDQTGTVRLWEQAGPARTVEAVLEYIKGPGMTETGGPAAVAAPVAIDNPKASETAAELKEHEMEATGVPGFGNTETATSAAAATVTADPEKPMLEAPLIKEVSKEEEKAAATAADVVEASTAAGLDGGVPEAPKM